MAGALGNLLIMLTADTGQARSDIGKTAHQVERDLKAMQRNATAAGMVIGNVVTRIAETFGRAALETLQFGDQLNKLSQRTSFGVERLSEMSFAAQLAGVSVTDMGASLGMFSKVLADAANESSESARIFKAMGVDVTQGPQVAFEQFAKAINALPDGELKVAAMRAAFGRSGDVLIPMIKGLDEASEKARALGLVMSKQMAEDSERFNDAMTVLGTSIRSLALTAMQPLTAWLSSVAEGMVQAKAKGNLFKNTILEIGMLWASLWGGIAEKTGAKNLATVMQSEFNRLLKMQQEMSAAAQGAGVAVGKKPNVNPDALRLAVSGAGGKKKDDSDFVARQLEEGMEEEARVMAEAATAADKLNQALRERAMLEEKWGDTFENMTTEEIRQWEQRKLAALDALEEIEDNQARLAAGFDENGKKIIDDTKKAKDLAHELGLTFTSAFEDAVIAGKKFSDVLRGLAQDIAKVILRKTVTEPAGKFISAAIEGLFKAEGGPVSGGKPYIVGEQGPELFVPNVSGGIVPNHALGGVGGGTSVTNVFQFSANTPAASRDAVLSMMPLIEQRTRAAVRDERNRTGDRR